MILHRQFFGDKERDFALSPALITELERTTGAGIGGLCRKLFAGDFALLEITETIRLALVGGGTAPADAAPLTQTYAASRPLNEGLVLAIAILNALYFGRPIATPPKKDETDGPA